MKILQLISSYGFFGAENVALELGRELRFSRIENTIGIFKNSQNPHLELAEHANKDNLKTRIFNCNGKIDYKVLVNIRNFIRQDKTDIIHAHGYKSNIYGFIVAKLMNKAIVSTCHNWIADDIKTKIYYQLEKAMLPLFNKTIAVSDAVKNELLRIGVKESKVTLINNGINYHKFEQHKSNVRNEFNINDKIKVVGTVARFTPEKGLLNLLQSARKVLRNLPDVKFMLVGDGPQKNELVKKTHELGIHENIIFTGMRNDIPEIYSAIDIFVLPSLNEGLPMVLLEVMAAKKPIIATKVGAIPKVLEHNHEGILVNPGNVDELYQALMQLLRNELCSKTLVSNAYAKVVQRFSSKSMCSDYIKMYEEVLSS